MHGVMLYVIVLIYSIVIAEFNLKASKAEGAVFILKYLLAFARLLLCRDFGECFDLESRPKEENW